MSAVVAFNHCAVFKMTPEQRVDLMEMLVFLRALVTFEICLRRPFEFHAFFLNGRFLSGLFFVYQL